MHVCLLAPPPVPSFFLLPFPRSDLPLTCHPWVVGDGIHLFIRHSASLEQRHLPCTLARRWSIHGEWDLQRCSGIASRVPLGSPSTYVSNQSYTTCLMLPPTTSPNRHGRWLLCYRCPAQPSPAPAPAPATAAPVTPAGPPKGKLRWGLATLSFALDMPENYNTRLSHLTRNLADKDDSGAADEAASVWAESLNRTRP
ncbi:uncharacterized protein LY79DRAFT_158397 [Colletotrichum navitas]|uniref:Uncharacterized protein n=1 Tax=Colletotrichum navitas TaxID=681940 RepID=A0AAD8PJW5_9PEZI|nr:uncharacterized protein LY79DRAFT_158397 [Colletotrichum navitas]KAK1564200.1 hypothetical protein LY79DRAFT_158397 [Colletotrichum navitas]